MSDSLPPTPLYAGIPFVLALLGIALLPLLAKGWWCRPKNQLVFAAALALATAIELLSRDRILDFARAGTDYLSFIALLASLYVVSGGIAIRGAARPTARSNTAILALGAILASLIGTTGASLLLIRPLIRANRMRKHKAHLPILFIFVVANGGGLLLPIGDPPLFLGYLHGVPFFWTLSLFPAWAFANGLVLAIGYAIDRRLASSALSDAKVEPLRIAGGHNLLFLAAIVASTALLPIGWRELAMLCAAAGSMRSTKKAVRDENGFTFYAIIEVAIVFLAIFATLPPATDLLEAHRAALGLTTPREYYFATGLLSSILDNAPTYLAFKSLAPTGEPYLAAVSLGAVLFGGLTYVGNGPNFMVKIIAEEAGYPMPSFFGFIGWSAAILGPVLILVGLLFTA